MRVSLFTKKTKVIMLGIVLVIMIFITVKLFNPVRTLYSLKRVEDTELYVMNYYGEYKFDKYLKKGCSDYNDLTKFLKKNLVLGRTSTMGDKVRDACTTFSAYDKQGNHIYGRNLDLSEISPGLLLFTKPPKGYSSVSLVELGIIGYNDSSKISSGGNPISMIKNSYLLGAPFLPRDGMNEKGLVVATLNVPYDTSEKDDNKVTIQRWPALRLMLDNAKNVEEAVTLLKRYNSFDGAVHYFIADAEGNSAAVEYYAGKIQVVKGSEKYQVLSNYIASSYGRLGTGQDRYDTANDMLKEKNGVITSDEAMNILKTVARSTVWSAVYNQNTGDINVAIHKQYNDVKNFKFNLTK
jgi:hypothetical protein